MITKFKECRSNGNATIFYLFTLLFVQLDNSSLRNKSGPLGQATLLLQTFFCTFFDDLGTLSPRH